jgi:hypothetical protein
MPRADSTRAKPVNDLPVTDEAIEADRKKGPTVVAGRGPSSNAANHAGLQQASRQRLWENAQRSPARNKGRRTMGRGGGR